MQKRVWCPIIETDKNQTLSRTTYEPSLFKLGDADGLYPYTTIHDAYTLIHDERFFQGTWSRLNIPLLVLPITYCPVLPLPSTGGRWYWIAGAVDLLGFMVEQREWCRATGLIIERTKALIASDYFSELT